MVRFRFGFVGYGIFLYVIRSGLSATTYTPNLTQSLNMNPQLTQSIQSVVVSSRES